MEGFVFHSLLSSSQVLSQQMSLQLGIKAKTTGKVTYHPRLGKTFVLETPHSYNAQGSKGNNIRGSHPIIFPSRCFQARTIPFGRRTKEIGLGALPDVSSPWDWAPSRCPSRTDSASHPTCLAREARPRHWRQGSNTYHRRVVVEGPGVKYPRLRWQTLRRAPS